MPPGRSRKAELHGRRETFIDGLFAGRVPQITGAPIGRSAIAGALTVGGYPEAIARTEPRRRGRWFEEYVAMTLERDVRDLTRNAQQLGELPTLLHLAATRISGLLSPTGIARDAGMSRPTVQRYLTLLEQLFLLIRARAWSRNIGQRLIKAPKVWIPDTGLACHLLDYDQARFEEDETALPIATRELRGDGAGEAGSVGRDQRPHPSPSDRRRARGRHRARERRRGGLRRRGQAGRHRTFTRLQRPSPSPGQAGSSIQRWDRNSHGLRDAALRPRPLGIAGFSSMDARDPTLTRAKRPQNSSGASSNSSPTGNPTTLETLPSTRSTKVDPSVWIA